MNESNTIATLQPGDMFSFNGKEYEVVSQGWTYTSATRVFHLEDLSMKVQYIFPNDIEIEEWID